MILATIYPPIYPVFNTPCKPYFPLHHPCHPVCFSSSTSSIHSSSTPSYSTFLPPPLSLACFNPTFFPVSLSAIRFHHLHPFGLFHISRPWLLSQPFSLSLPPSINPSILTSNHLLPATSCPTLSPHLFLPAMLPQLHQFVEGSWPKMLSLHFPP